MNLSLSVPKHEVKSFFAKKHKYVLCIFTLNEMGRLQNQLKKMAGLENQIDIVIADGGSTDGCTDAKNLPPGLIRAVLTKQDTGALGSQMRMAFHYAMQEGYSGVVAVDGNDKDDVKKSLSLFIEALDQGVDHVQGSRFIEGGFEENTPLSRKLGVHLLHAPMVSLASGFRYTDTTNGFRAYSKKLLVSPQINILRPEFSGYELHYVLAIEAAKLGFRVKEVPVTRIYPQTLKVPTKISPIRGNLKVLSALFKSCFRYYSQKKNSFSETLLNFDISTTLAEPWIYFVSWIFSSLTSYFIFLSHNSEIKDWPQRIIGIASLYDLSVPARSITYCLMVASQLVFLLLGLRLGSLLAPLISHKKNLSLNLISGVLSVLTSFWLAHSLTQSFSADLNHPLFLNFFIFFLSVLALPWILSYLLKFLSLPLISQKSKGLVSLALILLIGLIGVYQPESWDSLIVVVGLGIGLRLTERWTKQTSIAANSLFCFFIFLNLFVWGSVLYSSSFSLSIATFLILGLISLSVSSQIRDPQSGSPLWLRYLSLCSALSLFFLGISQELQFIFYSFFHVSPHVIWLSLSMMGVISLWLKKNIWSQKTPAWLISWILTPLLLGFLSFVLFYKSHFLIPWGDGFHVAERFLPLQQLALFSQIPWWNLYPTHGFSDEFGPLLTQSFSSLTWLQSASLSYTSEIVLFLAGYLFFALLTEPIVALGLITFFYSSLFNPRNFLFFIFLLPFLFRTQKSILRILLSFLTFFSYFFYPAIGIPLIATFMTLAVVLWPQSKTWWRDVFLGCALSPILFAHGNSFSVQDLISTQSQAMGRLNLTMDSSHFFWLYFLFPTSLLILLIFTVVLKKMTLLKYPERWILIFATLLWSMIEFNRSFERHTLPYSNDKQLYLFAILVGILGLLYTLKNIYHSRLLTLLLLGGLSIFQFSQAPFITPLAFQLTQWTQDTVKERTQLEIPQQEREIVEFLKTHLKNQETFYDMSNTLSLYLALDKKFPTFIIPSLYHTGDKIQAQVLAELTELFKKDALKFIVFKRPPQSLSHDWNNLDGVAQEVRSFQVTEWVYQNFKPCEVVGGYQIFCLKDNDSASPSISQSFDLVKLPQVWNKSHPQNTGATNITFKEDQNTYSLSPQSLTHPFYYLMIDACSREESKAELISRSNQSRFTFTIPACSQQSPLWIRLSVLHEWFKNPQQSLMLKSSSPLTLQSIQIIPF